MPPPSLFVGDESTSPQTFDTPTLEDRLRMNTFISSNHELTLRCRMLHARAQHDITLAYDDGEEELLHHYLIGGPHPDDQYLTLDKWDETDRQD